MEGYLVCEVILGNDNIGQIIIESIQSLNGSGHKKTGEESPPA